MQITAKENKQNFKDSYPANLVYKAMQDFGSNLSNTGLIANLIISCV